MTKYDLIKENELRAIKTLGFDTWFNIYCEYLRNMALATLVSRKEIRLEGNEIIWLNNQAVGK
jgi:hypothetical protein